MGRAARRSWTDLKETRYSEVVELTRRGIFGLLGGALLAKVVGPQLIAAPTPKLWEAAKVLPVRPVVNTYVPLQYVCAETLRIVDEELKWLHLRRHHDHARTRLGDTVRVHEPSVFVPWESDYAIAERYRPVTLDSTAHVRCDLSTLDPDCPFGELSAMYIEPMARALAENIIRGIRRKGGGAALATGRLEVPGDVDRCVLAHNDGSGLGIQAIEYAYPETNQGGRIVRWRPTLQLNMLYGVG